MAHEVLSQVETDKKVRLYHASPRRFRYGDVLFPGPPTRIGELEANGVFLTTSPIPHYSIFKDIAESETPVHIYEVEPLSKASGGPWDVITVEKARVVRYVGNGVGIASNRERHFKKKALGRSDGPGSSVKETYIIDRINDTINNKLAHQRRKPRSSF